jgi:hypothetical protein
MNVNSAEVKAALLSVAVITQHFQYKKKLLAKPINTCNNILRNRTQNCRF